MGSLREITENLSVFDYSRFFFKSQSLVFYKVSSFSYERLSKIALIAAIRYYLLQLHMLGYDNDIKRGFVLYEFKYYELSVYLHGLIDVYSGLKGFPPVGNLFIKRFSHLPHDVLKPSKETVVVECACLHDSDGSLFFVAYHNSIFFADNFDLLKSLVRKSFPLSRYILVFKLFNELPF